MNTTLLIMAAGIGSRFGTGIKQLEPVDDAGHIIMDYSIHDAIEAGFNHVVFIIRKDIEKEFKEVIGDRIASICSSHNVTVDYAFQDINDIPGTLPEGRTKPWGTGQAVLAAKKVIKTPFIVINADDYYGKKGFKAVHEYLVNGGESCMAGFVLKNTLSDNGGVTRGICKMDDQNNLTEVVETKNIVKTTDGAEADGKVIDVDSLVSMNMWGLTPDFLDVLEEGFKEFFEKEVLGNPLKAEYLIPNQEAFDVIMSQKSDRRNEIQFQAGAAELDRIEIATKMKAHFLAGRLSYERRPTNNNQYHGNLLVKNDISKPLKRLIKYGLATLANDKIYPNPNV